MKKYLPSLVNSPKFIVHSNKKNSTNYELSTTNSSGFTLIELMVVVTIIAFLSVIGIVAFTNAQAQARDGRRRADIDAIATALEANRTLIDGTYLAVNDTNKATLFADGKIPVDPINTLYGGTITYSYSTVLSDSDKKFTVCAVLEKATGNSMPLSGATGVAGCTGVAPTTPNTGQCYCRKSQQ